MSLFKKQTDEIQSKLDGIEAENTELSEQIETLKASIITKDEAFATLTASNTELMVEKQEADEKIEALETEVIEVKADRETFDEQVSAEAAKLTASLGHESIEDLDDEDTGAGGKDLLAQFQELDGAEKSAFYEENKAAIRALIN